MRRADRPTDPAALEGSALHLPRGRSKSELERLFPGDSEMAGRMRGFVWAATPLGPRTNWPHSLGIAVDIMLNSRYPMFIWWGRKLINLYNDAYMPMLGKRHPDALGRPAAEVWSDIWHTVGPQAEVVLNEGRATWSEELLLVMERNQFLEETYFTYSYSPIPDDEGGVGGVFCACTEDTHRVLSQRRLRTLRDLSARSLSRAKSTGEVCEIAAADACRESQGRAVRAHLPGRCRPEDGALGRSGRHRAGHGREPAGNAPDEGVGRRGVAVAVA